MPLLRELHRTHRLAAFPALWLTPTRPEMEFCDLKADPGGLRNIASDPARATRVVALNATLDEWIASSRDQGALGDPTTEPPLAEIQKSKRADYNRTWQKRLGKPEPTDSERVAWWMKEYGLGTASTSAQD